MNIVSEWKKGDIISVKGFPNQVFERRVVGTLGDSVVFVCNEEEFNEALEHSREPVAIGFPIRDVIMNKNESGKERT